MPTVAVIGGGQLARMMQAPATALGVTLRPLVEAADGAAGRASVGSVVGLPTERDALVALGSDLDVVTFEHEHIPPELFAHFADRVPTRPGPAALRCARDKLAMRQALQELGVPCPRWRQLATAAELTEFLAQQGGQAVVKTARGGYDGKGVRVVEAADQVADWLAAPARHGGLLVEEKVNFGRELAALVARRPSGQVVAWPVVETRQRAGVCDVVIAPAPELAPTAAAAATAIAEQIADALDVTGVLAVEMFETADGRLLVNELAMRPHNSGHWTINGAATSQFEQHLRAVLDLPLGPPTPTSPVTVMVNVLGAAVDPATLLGEVFAAYPQAHVELYGKAVRPGRKLGHVNVCGPQVAQALAAARGAADILMGKEPR